MGADCISRADAIKAIQNKAKELTNEDTINGLCGAVAILFELSSVTPQASKEITLEDVKEYCKPRLLTIITNELYHVLTSSKIKVVEKEIMLYRIRAEIEDKYGQCDICEYFEDYDYEENDISEYRPIGNIADILQIIDKYKEEMEKPQ